MIPPFRLPDAAVLGPVESNFPGREQQIRSLATLVHPDAAPCRNVVLHGTEATGKSTMTEQLLARLAESTAAAESRRSALDYAVINAAQCVSGRHLFERIVRSVDDALLPRQRDESSSPPRAARAATRRMPTRCESLAQLSVALRTMLTESERHASWRFVLVLDAIDRQRDAPPTLLPGLARLSETIPCLTSVFIVTAPPAGFLRVSTAAHLHFHPYTKLEFVRILALTPPSPIHGSTQQETTELWTRFCAAVHDAFAKAASRTLPSFRYICRLLWPHFTAPVAAGTHSPKDFSKLLIAARVHFQDESLLNPSIVSVRLDTSDPSDPSVADGRLTLRPAAPAASSVSLTALLPIAARLLLLAAYLASHNSARYDLALFSTHHHRKKRRRGGGLVGNRTASRTKHRKIARKLLGAHAFVLERMVAIFEAVRSEWVPEGSHIGTAGLDGDLGMAVATLASLRLLVRVGTGDLLDRAGKWRINVGWEAIRGIGRSIGVEVEDWLIE